MATPIEQPGEKPQMRAQASDLRKLVPFESPQSSPWVVPLPEGAVPKLLLGFRGSSMDDRYFVYTDGPSVDGEVVVHIHRSWTGYALADITIKIPCGKDGQLDPEGDGAKTAKITYEASQKRWDYEMLGLANLDTAKGFAMHVCGDWVFDIRFPKPIWNDVDARFQKATADFMTDLEALEKEHGNKSI